MSDAERQAHAAKEFDEAAAIRRAGPQPVEDLAAIVAAIDEAIERGWDLTLQLQISHNWPTIRAALERLSQREDVIARLDREVEGHIELVVETQRSRDAALARERELRELAAELAEFALDAAGQGSGNTPLSFSTWHNFMSTWEWADGLFRRADFRALLSDEVQKALLAQPAAETP